MHEAQVLASNAKEIRKALGEGFQWAVKCPGAPGKALIAQHSAALDKLEMIVEEARDAVRLRSAYWTAIQKIERVRNEMELKEMESGR
jgi:hypothetical protein